MGLHRIKKYKYKFNDLTVFAVQDHFIFGSPKGYQRIKLIQFLNGIRNHHHFIAVDCTIYRTSFIVIRGQI